MNFEAYKKSNVEILIIHFSKLNAHVTDATGFIHYVSLNIYFNMNSSKSCSRMVGHFVTHINDQIKKRRRHRLMNSYIFHAYYVFRFNRCLSI